MALSETPVLREPELPVAAKSKRAMFEAPGWFRVRERSAPDPGVMSLRPMLGVEITSMNEILGNKYFKLMSTPHVGLKLTVLKWHAALSEPARRQA